MAKNTKQYVLVKNTKEKLEVISVTENVTRIKNTKGEFYNVPNDYLITLEEYLFIKSTLKKTK
jgi:hypothetical protein